MKKCFCGNEMLGEYSPHYYKCDQCNVLVSKNNFDNEIYTITKEDNDLYGENYWKKVMVEEAGVKDIDDLIDMYMSGRAIYWIKNILKYTKLGGEIAEVGCGLGQLSYFLKQAGYNQTAFELSPQICKLINEKLDINVICGELKCSKEEFDTIVAIDVFEHLMDPENFLKDCKERLKEDGVLVIQMPCYDEKLTYAEMKKEKPNFEHLLIPDQHIFLYSRMAIMNLLQKYGFNNITFEPAFFGDDYDMFLFASPTILSLNDKEEIYSYLGDVSSGRLIKAIIKVYDEKVKAIDEKDEINKQRNQLLADVETLTVDIQRLQKEKDMFQEAAEERLENIEKLSVIVNDLTVKNRILQQAADQKQKIINELNLETEDCRNKEDRGEEIG